MVSIQNLRKTYNNGKTIAVDSVTLEVSPGELFGLIGPDGAGKTTLFRMLTTLLLPDSGVATVDNLDIIQDYKSIRSHIGYMPGKFSLYQDLTVEENLNFFATLFGTTVQENYHLIKDIYTQIEPFKYRRAGKLSGGMKQKLALSCALIHKPHVLFLDEPTTGVDPVSRKEFWEMLRRLRKEGITILVSTPYMDEATLCDRIGLIQEGKLLAIVTTQHIVDQYPEKLYKIRADRMPVLLQDLRLYPHTLSCFTFGEYLHLSLKANSETILSELQRYLRARHHTGLEMDTVIPTIEDCFIRLLNS